MAVGAGQSTINYSGIKELEGRVFESGYAEGTTNEDKRANTGELHLGYVLSRRYGVKIEASMLRGFKHTVHTKGALVYEGFREEFTVDRVVRAEGYMLSVIWEKQLSQRTHFYGRIGGILATAMVDIHPMGSEFSVHAERSRWVPAVGLGARIALDDAWSVRGEYRLIGTDKLQQGVINLQYSP